MRVFVFPRRARPWPRWDMYSSSRNMWAIRLFDRLSALVVPGEAVVYDIVRGFADRELR